MFFVFLFFGREPSKRLVSKMKRRKKRKQQQQKKREALQISLSGVWKPSNFIRNEHKKKTKSSDSFIWKIKKKKTHILVNCTLA